MSEVVNNARGGVRTRGLTSAPVTPTVGTAGRTAVSGYNLAPLFNVASNVIRNKQIADKQAEAQAENKSASGSAQQFEALNTLVSQNASAQEVGDLAFGGEPTTEQGVADLRNFMGRYEAAKASGNNRYALELARNRATLTALRNYPGDPTKVLGVIGKLRGQSSNLDKEAFRDETEAHAREKAAADKAATLLETWAPGITAGKSNQQILQQLASSELGQQYIDLQRNKVKYDSIMQDTNLSNAQKKQHVAEVWNSGEIGKTVINANLGLVSVLSNLKPSGGNQAEMNQEVSNTIRQKLLLFRQHVAQDGSAPDAATFDKNYGDFFKEWAKRADDIEAGRYTSTQMENQWKGEVAVQRQYLNSETGGGVVALAAINQSVGSLVNALGADPTIIKKTGDLLDIALSLAKNPKAEGTMDGGKIKDKGEPPAEVYKDAQLQVHADEVAKSGKYPDITPENKLATGDNLLAQLSSPKSLRTLAVAKAIVPRLADEKFWEDRSGRPVPQEAINSVERFRTNRVDKLLSTINSYANIQKKTGNSYVSLGFDDSGLTFDVKAGVPKELADAFRQVAADINQSSEALYYMSGKRGASKREIVKTYIAALNKKLTGGK